MNFVTEYPAWFILLCILTGGIYTFLLYFRSQKEETGRWTRYSLMIFRFLSVTIISFLLLSPLIRKKSEIIEKPLIIIAQDNSRSVVLSKDSAYYREKFGDDMKSVADKLSAKFETATFTFGDRLSRGLSTDFNENQTDMSMLFSEIGSRFVRRNIGAIIIASDGIYNHGATPYYLAEKFNFPIYSVALGDTTVRRDVILKKITHNRTAFIGDVFPVEIQVEANMMQGERTEIKIMQDEKVIGSKQISFPAERSFQKVSFTIEAKEKGIRKYSVQILPVKGEETTFNNSQDFYIEVTDSRQKVVFLYSSPHPDIAALRSALESSARFELEDYNINEFNQPVDKYDLVVLSQVPSLSGYASLDRILKSPVSILYILGSQSGIDAFNTLKTGLTLTGYRNTFNESLPAFNQDFALFNLGNNITDMIANVPPLVTPFGNYQTSPATDVLFYQKIGEVRSNIPLVMFFNSPERKTGIIAGENIWKWRLSDYLQNENHAAFDELIDKIVQYLSVKGDKSFFRIRVNSRFLENEEVEIDAEVYNESYELINTPDVSITITDEDGKKFPFVMGKTAKAYYLNAGNLKPGRYSYSASVKVGRNSYTRQGEFVVTPVNLETINTVADHNLMYRLASSTGGEMIFPADINKLPEMISARDDIKPVSFIQKSYSDLIGNIIVFLLILGLLSAEWFLRKRSGNY